MRESQAKKLRRAMHQTIATHPQKLYDLCFPQDDRKRLARVSEYRELRRAFRLVMKKHPEVTFASPIPTEETKDAVQELESGGAPSFPSTEALMTDLQGDHHE